MNEHEMIQELMTEYLDGVISPEDLVTLEGHVAACGECASVFDTMKEIRELESEEYPVPPELLPAVMDKIRAAAPAKKPRVVWLRWAGLAAAVAIVSFAGVRMLGGDGAKNSANDSVYFAGGAEAPMSADANFAPGEAADDGGYVTYSFDGVEETEGGFLLESPEMSLMMVPADEGDLLSDAMNSLTAAAVDEAAPADAGSEPASDTAAEPAPDRSPEPAAGGASESTVSLKSPGEPETQNSETGFDTEITSEEAEDDVQDIIFNEATGEEYSSGRLILSLDAEASGEDRTALLEKYGMEIIYDYDNLDMLAVRLPKNYTASGLDALIAELEENPIVLGVSKDYVSHTTLSAVKNDAMT